MTPLEVGSSREYLIRLRADSDPSTAQESRDLARRSLEMQDAERQRIARELYDGLAQDLFSLKLAWSIAQPLGPTIDNLLAKVNRLALDLYPMAIDELGLNSVLPSAFRCYTNVSVRVQGSPCPLESPREIALFRIAQEAVDNSRRHGQASRICVQLNSSKEQIELRVEDDGIGFNPDLNTANGLGIVRMSARAKSAGAELQIHSAPHQGTQVVVTMTPQ